MTRPEEVIAEALSVVIATGDRVAAHAVIEAIRAMSPDEQADLIGGRVVEYAGDIPTAHELRRVVGPWVEVSDV